MAEITQLKLAIIFLGAVFVWMGYKELLLAQDAAEVAQPIELAQIEAGDAPPDNPHLEIGSHWSMYQELVYSYNEKTNPDGPDEDTKVQYAYYPILSDGHPVIWEREIQRKLGDLDDAQLPAVEGFSVLVKSTRFDRVSNLPQGWVRGEPIRGMVVNRINEFKRGEVALLTESFPNLDLSQVVVFTEGREPTSQKKLLAMFGGGSVACIFGFGWLLIGAMKSSEPDWEFSDDPSGASNSSPH
jgi:hypothetical protein